MYRVCFLFLLLIISVQLAAGKGVVPDNITFKYSRIITDPAPTGDFQTLIVPIKRAGNLIVVEAAIDSLEGNFILDTGAPGLVLNETYFRDYPKLSDLEVSGVNGRASGSFATTIHNFKILDLQYSRLTATVTDLSTIENGRNIKILGLMGTRLFSKFAITVDLVRNVLYIQKVGVDGNIPVAEQLYHNSFMVTPFKYVNNVILIKGVIQHRSLWFGFDSAAETNLLDYNRNKKLLPDMQALSRSKVAGIGGSGFEVVYARFDTLTVGDHVFANNRTLLTNLQKIGDTYGFSVDGILGYDFFVRGIFTINFVKKEFEMYIYANQ